MQGSVSRARLVALVVFLLPQLTFAYSYGDRVKAAAGGANVRSQQLTTVYTQDGGVHGTIVGNPTYGTAGGYTGNWWPIQWDAQPPAYAGTGWSAESVISFAPSAGDVAQPNFGTADYTTANVFWTNGYAPGSTNPPNPQLGTALGNCTWYAHGRMRELGYNTTQLGAMTGNANQWDNQAIAAGITVNSTPSVGSIAQSDTAGGYGHVAVVESVNNDGTITISESSYTLSTTSTWNFLFRHRTIAATWFQNFIHVSKAQTLSPPTPQSPGTSTDTGFTVGDTTPQFSWVSGTGASRYGLYISKSPYGQSNIVYSNDYVSGNSLAIPSGTLQSGTRYRWNMSSFDAAGSESSVSSTLYFQTPAAVDTTLGGVITNSVTGAAISGASVSFGGVSGSSGSNGSYLLTGLPCVSSYLDVAATGYTGASIPYSLPNCPGSNTRDVALQPSGSSSTHDQISAYADQLSTQYKVPAVLIKAVMYQESTWDPAADHDEGNNVHGLGLMQVTVNITQTTANLSLGQIDESTAQGQNPFTTTASMVAVDTNRLKTDWQYNMEIGTRLLVAKKVASGGAGDDATILENWYYPLAYFNGAVKYVGQSSYATSPGPYNDPVWSYPRSGTWHSKSNFPYQECVFNLIAHLDSTVPADIYSLMSNAIKVTLPGPGAVMSGAGQFSYLEPVFCFWDWAVYTSDGIARVGNGGGKNNGCISTYVTHTNVAFHAVPFGSPANICIAASTFAGAAAAASSCTPTPPAASTTGATGVGTTAATLNGSVNPNGKTTIAWFEYGTSTAYGSSTPQTAAGAGTAYVPVSSVVTTLSPGTTYHARIVASNADGVTPGSDVTFTTSGSTRPSVTTDPPTDIISSGAWLNATVNPNGYATTTWFAYSQSPSPTSPTTAQVSIGSGTTSLPVSSQVAGLSCGTTYYVRAVASSTQGTQYGLDRTFTTAACNAPVVATLSPTAIDQTSATLRATVNPKGNATSVVFLYGTTTAYGFNTAPQDAGSADATTTVTATVSGLNCSTTYHYTAQASSIAGTPLGGDVSFTTATCAAPPQPTSVAATALGSTVHITWSGSIPAGGAFKLSRRSAESGFVDSYVTTSSPSYDDGNVSAGHAYIYWVTALNATGQASPPSLGDAAILQTFTDDPVYAGITTVRAQHVLELQQAANALRAAAGLSSSTFRSPSGIVLATDIQDIRDAITAARTAASLPLFSFSDPILQPQTTPVRAVHVNELRSAIK